MAGLIIEICKRILASCVIASFLAAIITGLQTLGDNSFQSKAVIAFYIYCILVLFIPSPHKLFHVISIPILSQFLHIFQKYSFTAGANSVWRLVPFILLDLYFINFFARTRHSASRSQDIFILSWVCIQSFFLIISPNLEMIIGGAIIIYLITLPLFFLYLNAITPAIDMRPELEKYFFLLFLILGIGTFGLIHFGAVYKGSDNLLVTRNIADTNVTMAYFILLWPFALGYVRRQKFASALTLMLTCLFGLIVILSFSRGAVLLIIPYLFITLFLHGHYLKWLILCILIVWLNFDNLFTGFQNLDLSYFWSLRFADILSSDSSWDRIQVASGRLEIQRIAYDLFLEKPLTGHGTGSFEVLGPGFREAHSLYYTLLAEQGMAGALYYYLVFVYILFNLNLSHGSQNRLMLLAFVFYIIFNHTVGSVFVIIPAKSISVNCIAPVLLICVYFYCQHKPSKNQEPVIEQQG